MLCFVTLRGVMYHTAIYLSTLLGTKIITITCTQENIC